MTVRLEALVNRDASVRREVVEGPYTFLGEVSRQENQERYRRVVSVTFTKTLIA